MNNNQRTNRTDGEWEELIKEFNASGLAQGVSGLAQGVFCEQRGVNFHSFRRRSIGAAHSLPASDASPRRRPSPN